MVETEESARVLVSVRTGPHAPSLHRATQTSPTEVNARSVSRKAMARISATDRQYAERKQNENGLEVVLETDVKKGIAVKKMEINDAEAEMIAPSDPKTYLRRARVPTVGTPEGASVG